MREFVTCGFIFCCCLTSIGNSEEADKNFPIALLNVEKVFRQSKSLQTKLAALREQVKELEETVQLRQVELETLQKKLGKTPPDSPEHSKLQVQMAKLQAESRAFIEQEKRTLSRKEARVHAEVYRDMDAAVKKLCQERKIKLVIRQVDGNLEDERAEEVLKVINRVVIYEDHLEITDDVLKMLTSFQTP